MNLELCRLCGKNSGLTDVFEELDLWSKIFMCFGVKIHKEDVITRKICKSCYFFTNSVYEFRLSSIAHDETLRNEIQPKIEINPPVISYPDISQDAFLNTLNLANKHGVDLFKKPVFHPSIVRLKRKYPNLNLPQECFNVDVDPSVPLGNLTKIPRLTPDNLGIWSIKKKSRGKQSDLILTRVRVDSAAESDSGSDTFKYNFKHDSAMEIQNSTLPLSNTSTAPLAKKRHKSRYPVYGGRKTNRSSVQKKSPPKNQKESKKQNIPTTSTAVDRGALKSLLQSDAKMNESLQKDNVENISETTIPRLDDYDNLLVSRGDEVQTFICQTCNKIFDTLQQLNQHKKYSHKSSLRCTKCSKRFSIVETLLKHNLTCHAEPMKLPMKPEEKKEVIKTVARKKTNGCVPASVPAVEAPPNPPPPVPLPPSSSKDIIEYVISSDDDIEFFDEAEKKKTVPLEKPQQEVPKEILPKPAIENVITAALEPQRSSNSAEENLILKAALAPQVANASKEKTDVENLIEKEKLPTPRKNEIFLIDDSDDEQSSEKATPAENNQTNKETIDNQQNTFLIEDTSRDSSKSKEIAASLPPISSIAPRQRSSDSVSSSLPSNSSSVHGTLLENDTIISQNIVVVPSAEDKDHMDASSPSVQAKITNELSYVNYIFNKCSFLDKPKNDKKFFLKDIQRFTEKTYLPVEIIKSTNAEVTIEYGPMATPKPGEKLAFWDTGNVIDIRKPETASKKTASPASQSKPGGSTNPAVVSQILKPVQLDPKSIQFSSNNFVVTPTHQTTSLLTNKTKIVQSEITKVGPNTKRAILNSGEDLSKAVLLVPSQNPLNNYQIVSNSAMNLNKTNIVLPSVAVSKVQTSVANIISHSQIAKSKLMATLQTHPKNNQVTTYNKQNPLFNIIPKPVQTVSPNRGPITTEFAKTTEQQAAPMSTGYILMGITANQDGVLQPATNTPIIIGEIDNTNKMIPKPIVINGMSYPSVTKIRNQQPSTIVLQPMVQETNVSIQNCINICQPGVVNALPAVMSTAQIQNPTCSTSTGNNVAVVATKPAIRIKNLSELTGDNMNTSQRNELHNLYTNALTNYVQNHSSNMTGPSNSEEYLQIS